MLMGTGFGQEDLTGGMEWGKTTNLPTDKRIEYSSGQSHLDCIYAMAEAAQKDASIQTTLLLERQNKTPKTCTTSETQRSSDPTKSCISDTQERQGKNSLTYTAFHQELSTPYKKVERGNK